MAMEYALNILFQWLHMQLLPYMWTSDYNSLTNIQVKNSSRTKQMDMTIHLLGFELIIRKR